MTRLNLIAAAMLAASLGAVQAQQRQELPPVQHQPQAGGSAAAGGGIQAPALPSERPLSQADRRFVAQAAMAGRAEVEAGEMAQGRSSDPGVRQLGERLVEDHRATNLQLAQIARARGMQAPQQVGPQHRTTLDRLRQLRGDAFDQAFLQQAGVRMHQQAIALFQQQAQRQDADPALRNFARQNLPTLQRHLDMAQSLQARATTPGATAAAGAAAATMGREAQAQELREARDDIRDAVQVVQRMKSDPGVATLLQRARGVFIVSDYGRAALGVGVQGGQGVLVTRDAGGGFGNPVFYKLGGLSVGPQAGAAAGELAFLLMTERAVQQFRSDADFSLTADAGLVIGPYSTRGHASAGKVQDVVVWSGTAGAYAGASVGLTDVIVDEEANRAYYGRGDASPLAILGGRIENPHGNTLARVLAI